MTLLFIKQIGCPKVGLKKFFPPPGEQKSPEIIKPIPLVDGMG
jgi:hypothetical protein